MYTLGHADKMMREKQDCKIPSWRDSATVQKCDEERS